MTQVCKARKARYVAGAAKRQNLDTREPVSRHDPIYVCINNGPTLVGCLNLITFTIAILSGFARFIKW